MANHIHNTIDANVRIGRETEHDLASEMVVANDINQDVDTPGADLPQTTPMIPGEGEGALDGRN